MKEKIKKIFSVSTILFFVLFFLFPIITRAQTPQQVPQNEGYVLLAPLPGIGGGNTGVTLTEYIPGLFNLLIGLGIAFAVVNVFIGGFQYMSSDAFQKKQDGRQRIENAIKGLLLVASAWLILYTINPNLLKFNLEINTIQTTQVGGTLQVPPGSSPSLPSGTGNYCYNCQTVNDSGLTLSTNARNSCSNRSEGCFLNQTLLGKLKNLNSQTNGLTITEVWPPTVNHQDICHQNGTCVDATIPNMTDFDSVKKFIDNAIKNNLKPVFESPDQDLINRLQKAGISSQNLDHIIKCTDTIKTKCITGPHFSLYN